MSTQSELLARASGSARSRKPWVPTYKARERMKPTALTPRSGGRSRSRVSSITKSKPRTEPVHTPEEIAKARAEHAERVRKAQELHEVRLAKANADLAAAQARADHAREALRAMSKLADDGFQVVINEAPEATVNYSHEEALALGLVEE